MDRGRRTTLGTRGRVLAVGAHQFRHAWRHRSLVVLTALLTLVFIVTAAVSRVDHATRLEQQRVAQQRVEDEFSAQPDRHPHRVSHYGYLAFRPPAPLGFLDDGVDAFTGTSLFLEAHRQNAPTFSRASQTSGVERLAALSVATVLDTYVPLLIFALAGVSVTREREQGTLALALSQGVSSAELLWGTWLGTLGVVFVALTPGLTGALVWLAGASQVHWSADLVARVAIWLLLHVAVYAACCAVAVAVSARAGSSREALTRLVGLWFALWIVVPRVLPVVATALHPLPVRASFDADVEARVRELGDSHNPNDPMFARLKDDVLRQHGVTRVEDLPFNYAGLVNREAEARTSEAYAQHLAALDGIYTRQNRVVHLASLVSPYVALRLASMALAGSDAAHAGEFERQAESFRFTLIQRLNELHMNEVGTDRDRYGALVNGAPTRQRIDRAFFEQMPTFTPTSPSVGWALRHQPAGLLAVALGLVASVLWLGRTSRGRLAGRV